MNSVILSNQSLKYQRFTRSNCKLEFVAKTLFLWTAIWRQLKNCEEVKIISGKNNVVQKTSLFYNFIKWDI